MLKPARILIQSVPIWLLAGPVFAQQSQADVQYEQDIQRQQERQLARSQIQEARQQLERAAREVASVYTVPAQFESLDRYIDTAGEYFNLAENTNWNWNLRARAQLGMTITDAESGVLVTQVSPGGAAADAGVKVGDVIESIDGASLAGQEASPYARLIERLEEIEPGDEVNLVVERAGESISVDVESREANQFIFANLDPLRHLNELNTVNGRLPLVLQQYRRSTEDGADGFDFSGINIARTFSMASQPWGDMELVTLTEDLGRYFDADEGLLVVRAPSDDSLDIQDGDVITAISGRTPNSPEHAMRILASFEPGETVELSIMRDRRRETVEYLMPESTGFGAVFPAPVFPSRQTVPGSGDADVFPVD